MCLFIFLLFSVNTLCFITLTVCTFLNTTIFLYIRFLNNFVLMNSMYYIILK